jgi:phage-related protein
VGKFFTDLWAKIKLFARAVGQLLSKGFVDGDVLDSLLTEEMAGLRRFLGGVVRVVTRIRAFFTGLRVGFKEFVSAAQPVWDNFKQSLEDVLYVARKLFDAIGKGSKGPVSESMASGARLGRFLGGVVTVIVDYAGVLMRFWSGFTLGVMSAVEFFRPVFTWLGEAFGELVVAVKGLFAELGLLNETGSFNTEVWGELGYAIGWVVTAAIQPMVVALRTAVRVVTWVVRAIGGVIGWVREKWRAFKADLDKLQAIEDRWLARLTKFSAKFKAIWQGIVDFVKGIFDDLKAALNGALDFIAEVADRIPQRFRPEFLDEFIATRQQGTGEGGSIGGRAAELVNASSNRGAGTEAAASANGLVGSLVARSAQRSSSEQARAAEQSGLLSKLAEAATKPATAAAPAVRLYIDGRELATRVESGQRKNAALAFEGGT